MWLYLSIGALCATLWDKQIEIDDEFSSFIDRASDGRTATVRVIAWLVNVLIWPVAFLMWALR